MFFRRPKTEQSFRRRLAATARPDGVLVLAALFERARSHPQIDARQFRIDFKDHRDAISRLSKHQFIFTDWQPQERYRLSLVALPLIDSSAARSMLEVVDRVLRYLSERYQSQPDGKITLGQLCADLDIPEQYGAEALGYLIDTPVAGPRKSGYPDSSDWWIAPVEKSLDFPDLDWLLRQLVEWATHEEPALRPISIQPGTLQVYPHDPAPPTPYDRLIRRVKNHKVLATLLAAVSAIVVLATGMDALLSIYEWISSAL